MARIVLDFGSGNTCKNDRDIIVQMYDALRKVDTGEHDVVVKWQLFKREGDNIPLDKWIFDFAYLYGQKLGYPVTASVFDLESLRFLLQYDVPFVKIANRRDLDWLIGEIPRRIPVYVSCGSIQEFKELRAKEETNGRIFFCVSEYPARPTDYEKRFMPYLSNHAISDHTTDFALWNTYNPEIIEWHYKLPDSTGLDAGPFARTPAQLKVVL